LDARSDAVTVAEIDLPESSGSRAARAYEKKFLAERPAIMNKRLKKTLRKSPVYRTEHTDNGRPLKPRKKTMVVHDYTDGGSAR
jgi:hypothetical protein